jgi:hypothetical protein
VEELLVAAGLILKFTGVGRAQYEAVNTKLGIDPKTGTGDWPADLLSHSAGDGDDGAFYVLEVWSSRAAQGTFMQNRLGRALQEGGITGMPQITWIDPLFAYHLPDKK